MTIESTQHRTAKVHLIIAIVDRQQSNAFSAQGFAEKHIVHLPGKLAVLLDGAYRHAVVVFRFGNASGKRSRTPEGDNQHRTSRHNHCGTLQAP